MGESRVANPTLSSTASYNTGASMADEVGATIAADAATVGAVFNLSGQETLMYMIFAVVLFCVIYAVSQMQGTGSIGALLLTLPVMGASMYFKITDVQLFGLLGVIAAFIFVYKVVFTKL